MGVEAAEELEHRLKNLVSAFSARTKRTKEKIAKPPTPSDSEDDLAVGEDDLLGRLREVCSPGSEFEGESRRKSIAERMKGSCTRKLRIMLNFVTCSYILDADGWAYIWWLMVVSVCFMYNAAVIPLRAVFPYQTKENVHIWQYFDFIADLVYVIDIIAFKSHRKFLREGFWIKDPVETRKSYFETLQFKIDLTSLFPADILVAITFGNYPLLRIPRMLKIDTYWELFQRFDTILASPHSARITKTLIYMVYMIHANACVYYGLSKFEGLCSTTWTFCAGKEGSAYIRCFYFATKTATSIGKNPRPDNKMEYMYMTFAWLSGVFVTAILIGQVRDIIATATKNQNDYRASVFAAVSYLHRLGVHKKLQNKVKLWLSYTWEQQKTLDESKILDLLPDKMRTDVALDLHVETLSKVKLFHHCEVPFLRDLVVKLKSIIFLPGDFICKKGEVGREMFIIQSGKIHVIGGPTGTQILVTLGEGSVFGEIALLGIGGMNKRTADVRAAGFANLFVLHKDGLEDAIRDYPTSQEIIKKKAKKLMKENLKKARAAAATAAQAAKESEGSTDSTSLVEGEVIIKVKEEPKLIETMKQIFPLGTKMGQYLSRGSKGTTELEVELDRSIDLMTSYPPTPYVPGSPNHISLELDISMMTGDSSDQQLSPPPPSQHHSPTVNSCVISPTLRKRFADFDPAQDLRHESLASTSSSVDELKDYLDGDGDDLREGSNLPDTSAPKCRIGPIARNIAIEIDKKASSSTDDERNLRNYGQVPASSSREVLPLELRPPVYPILPETSPGATLSSSEESVDPDGMTTKSEKTKVKRSGKEMTSRMAAIIASRFLTSMRPKAPLKRQQELEEQQDVEKTEMGKTVDTDEDVGDSDWSDDDKHD
ncbi:cyclic nucleotide-gated cation channel beta-3 [Folsomia candida]|uniref:cyclic nucleotide-gated cation channel beta-3 n=1 Tax=Folsomia candida TaxID=158441 RepID=UPI0016052391|nr:cyclic nucleotide-gated cation channel beta-3 [Folsomia candida]